jgi:Cu/Ag efflux pump CusA
MVTAPLLSMFVVPAVYLLMQKRRFSKAPRERCPL